ncbi:hypothetical protein M758_1G032400 [Ceratodon purpureus]|nr:hypothetical protein M758_1G032400 [Ceratodon purpureus]
MRRRDLKGVGLEVWSSRGVGEEREPAMVVGMVAMDLWRVVVVVVVMVVGSPEGCNAGHHRGRGSFGEAVVVEREDVCVVGSSQVEARYCARLSLRDIGTGEGFLSRLSWLRIESADLLLQGDGVGPLGTRMVLGLSDDSSEVFNGTSSGSKSRGGFDVAELSRMEQLLKEVIGGEAIGWSRIGALGQDREARVIQSPFKTMVVLPGGASLGVEMEALVPKSFRGSVPDVSSGGGHSGVSALGLWHWLPASSFNGVEKQDSWPSFFSSLGAASSDSEPQKRGRFLPQWLASRASLWSKELSSSQWQVHQRSLTLVSPRDKRQSLSLAYCESARSSSPPKCTTDTLKSGGSVVDHNIQGPGESELRVKLDSRNLSECSPSSAGGGDSEGHWVLEDMERTLVGKGSHRVMQSTFTLSGPAGLAQTLHDDCQLRMMERLPNGVFADQFELQGIQRRGGIKEARIHGDKDLEQPALLSTQSIVVVDVVLQKVNNTGSTAAKSLLQATAAIPLHARYPPLSVDSHSIVHIPMPHMFVSCQQEEIDLPGSRWNEVVTGSEAVTAKSGGMLDWMVPAGNPGDYSVVARFTAISALTGVLVVLGASVSGERRV